MSPADAMLTHAAQAMMIGLAAKDEDRKQAQFAECCDCLRIAIRQHDGEAGGAVSPAVARVVCLATAERVLALMRQRAE